MNTSLGAGVGFRPPFTPSQWQELEHQALIFKYLMAGLPVPPELVIPIKKSFDSMPPFMPASASASASFFHHPSMGYCSFYGKKADPEPGRCRRTDGKKWRCSKDAYPDSKYCERHMHRGRNRSRKPVETQTITPHHSSSPTLTSLSTTAAAAAASAASASFQNHLPLHSLANPQGLRSQLQMDPVSYRYLPEMKQEADEHSFLSDASGAAKGLGMDSSLESTWHLMPSTVSSLTQSKARSDAIMQTRYSQMHPLQDLGHAGDTSMTSKRTQQQQQHCFFGSEYGVAEPLKQDEQPLRPFFDEWPKTRDSWSDLEDERSNRASFSTTQLSISIPLASSDFSATSSRSLNDDKDSWPSGHPAKR